MQQLVKPNCLFLCFIIVAKYIAKERSDGKNRSRNHNQEGHMSLFGLVHHINAIASQNFDTDKESAIHYLSVKESCDWKPNRNSSRS